MTLDKLLLQVRRIAEHRELGAEKKIRATYKQCLKELKQFIGYEYATLAEDGKLTYDILAKKQAQARFLEEVQQHIDRVAPEIRSEMTQLISSVYNLSYNGMIEAAASSVSGEVSSALKGLSYVQPMQVKSGVDNTIIDKIMLNDVLEKNRKGVIYNLKQAINIGITNGETVDTMSKRISKVLDGDYKKSVRVARTEVHRVREAGLNEGARDFDAQLKEAGVDMRMAKIWRTMKDNRVRPNVVRKSKKGTITKMGHGANHIQMEGQAVLADEQFELSDGNMTDAPGQSGIASQDINCRCFVRYKLVSEEEYVQLTGKNFEGKPFTEDKNSDIIKAGAISGARNPLGKKAETHAVAYYESVRHMKTDVARIAKTTGFSEKEIQDIKNFIFYDKHDLGDGEPKRFEPDFMMAESWKRLINGTPEAHDMTMIKHEITERKLMCKGYTQDEAHIMASKQYNYNKEAMEFYGKIKKYRD